MSLANQHDAFAEPTTWSFLPALLIGLGSLASALALPPDSHGESSLLRLALLMFHFVAIVGSARGSVVFLFRRSSTPTRAQRSLAWACLGVALLDIAFFAGLFALQNWIASWGPVAHELDALLGATA